MNSRAFVAFLLIFLSMTLFASTSLAKAAPDEANALEVSGDDVKTIESDVEGKKNGPDPFPVEIELARQLKKEKRYPEAIIHFRRAVELSTGRIRYGVKKELAQVISWTRDKEQAIELYKELLAERPEDSEARMGLARVYSWTKRYDEAKGEYITVLERKPESTEARIGLARVNSWQGNYDEAISAYWEILKENPKNTEARVGLINVLRWKGDSGESLSEARVLLSQRPEDPTAKRLVRELRKSRGPYIQLTRSDGEDSDDNRLVRYKLSGYFSLWNDSVIRMSYSTYHATAPLSLSADAALFTIKSAYKPTKNFTLTPRVSIATVEATGGDVTRLLPALNVKWRQSKRLTLSTSYSQSMLLDTAQLIKNAIKLDEYSLSARYNAGLYTLSTGYRHGKYPDGNFSNKAYVNLSKNFIKRDPKLSGGVRLDYVNFDKNLNNGYYDPQDYLALTLHASLSGDYYDRRLFYEVVTGLGTQTKSSASAELKASVKGKLTWQFTGNLSAWASYKWSRSALESTTGYNYNSSEIGIGYLF